MITWLFRPSATSESAIPTASSLTFWVLAHPRGSLGFGAVARYWRLDPTKVTDGAGGRTHLRHERAKGGIPLQHLRIHNLFGNNCHQYAAHAMNLAGYQGKRDWNMVHVAANVLLKGRWVSPWAAVKTWGPFCVALVACAATGAWVSSRESSGRSCCWWCTSSYSFGYADPARKLYQTPNKVEQYSEDEVMGMQMHQAAGGGDDEEPPLASGAINRVVCSKCVSVLTSFPP